MPAHVLPTRPLVHALPLLSSPDLHPPVLPSSPVLWHPLSSNTSPLWPPCVASFSLKSLFFFPGEKHGDSLSAFKVRAPAVGPVVKIEAC